MIGLSVGLSRMRRRGGAGGGGGDALVSFVTATSHVINGVTYNFNEPVGVGSPVSNNPAHKFIYSTSPTARLVSTSAPSGDLNADGFIGNGLVINPWTDTQQGFDGYIGVGTPGQGTSAAATPYNAALNVDPALAGPLALTPNTTGVKSVRKTSVVDGNQWISVEEYTYLHFVDFIPFADTIAPSASALVKEYIREGTLNWTACQNIPLPASFTDTAESILAVVPSSIGHFGSSNGEQRRRFRLDEGSSGYSAGITDEYAKLVILLHDSRVSQSLKLQIARRICEFGVQLRGLMSRGYTDIAEVVPLTSFTLGAGQHGAQGPLLYATGFLLNDQRFINNARALKCQMNNNGYWALAEHVGLGAVGGNSVTSQPFLPEQVATPHIVPDLWSSGWLTRYGAIAAFIVAWENLAVLMFRNGPGGINGATAILNGPNNTSNPRAASLGFLSRHRAQTPYKTNAYVKTTAWEDLYDMVIPTSGYTPWTGPPDQIPHGSITAYDDDLFTAGDGSVSWNLNGHVYTTLPLTRVDFRYSLDKVQWIEETNVGLASTKSNLLRGAPHALGIRIANSAGVGPWSENQPYAQSPAPAQDIFERSIRTPTGTQANAAPVFTVNPKVYRRIYPTWGYKQWVEAEAVLNAADMVEGSVLLSAGSGYYTGFPAGTQTFRWKRDGAVIPGATSKEYLATRTVDGGGVVTPEITTNNGIGAPVVYDAPGTLIPVETEPAAPTVFSRVTHTGGTRLTRTGGFINVADGKAGAFAWKGRLTAGDGTFRSFLVSGLTGRHINMGLRASGNAIDLQMRDAAGNMDMNILGTVPITVATGEVLLLASWNVETGTGQLYLNGTNVFNAGSVLTNDVLKFATTQNLGVVSESDGAPPLDGQTDYVWFDNQFVDLSVPATRAIFSSPTDLGAWGRGPTGNRPLLFTWGNAASWNGGTANKGRGGVFTATGTFT